MTRKRPAMSEFEIHILLPFRINSFPTFLAVVLNANASVPAVGSVSAKLLDIWVAKRGKYLSFCSLVPNFFITLLIREFWMSTRVATAGSTLDTSSTVRMVVMKLQPAPP